MNHQHNTGAIPAVSGLILAGGLSRRMGLEKGLLGYHGEPQVRWLWRKLNKACGNAYVSLRANQENCGLYAGLPVFVDSWSSMGPVIGLLSAWERVPQAAWLVVAVDLPFLDGATLNTLIAGRRMDCLATAFEHTDGTLEPLCTIWEPTARDALADRVKTGNKSLRTLLEVGPISRLLPPSEEAITSVDSLKEYQSVLKRLRKI
ncbi:MAG: NTP transferase domain-containing protein [Gammaproteobacteria bacterium]